MKISIIILYLTSLFGSAPPEAPQTGPVLTEIIMRTFDDESESNATGASSSSALPYPQVPLGWRKVTLEWDDGWWQLDFTNR